MSRALQNNGESESAEVPAKPVIKKKRLIWDIQIDPDDADMAGASEEAIKMMTQSRRGSRLEDATCCLHTCLYSLSSSNGVACESAKVGFRQAWY